MVSQATRARLSWARIASSTASEIWSAILSGWPSETDSEVKRVLDIGPISLDSDGKMGADDTPPHRPAHCAAERVGRGLSRMAPPSARPVGRSVEHGWRSAGESVPSPAVPSYRAVGGLYPQLPQKQHHP